MAQVGTVSRMIENLSRTLKLVLEKYAPVLGSLERGGVFVADGTLCPAWAWRDRPENQSGKHHCAGMNVQVVCDAITGRLRRVSEAFPGSTHDAKAIKRSGFPDLAEKIRATVFADKGYIGCGLVTPVRKPPGKPLPESDKIHNESIEKIRWVVERTIAWLKTWKILGMPYRGPAHKHSRFIALAIRLENYRLSF
jgi:hypothetical protein